MPWLVLILFLVPPAVLAWRIVVTKSRKPSLKLAAAGAAMVTVTGAFVLFGDIRQLDFGDWRSIVALVAASTGSIFLLLWSRRKHSNKRHRTISIVGAIIGLVPVVATVTEFFLFRRGAS